MQVGIRDGDECEASIMPVRDVDRKPDVSSCRLSLPIRLFRGRSHGNACCRWFYGLGGERPCVRRHGIACGPKWCTPSAGGIGGRPDGGRQRLDEGPDLRRIRRPFGSATGRRRLAVGRTFDPPVSRLMDRSPTAMGARAEALRCRIGPGGERKQQLRTARAQCQIARAPVIVRHAAILRLIRSRCGLDDATYIQLLPNPG